MTRREYLSAAAGVAGTRLLPAKAAQPQTAVNFALPEHACDCHTHIYGPQADFPLSPRRTYTPETALPPEMSALHRALRIERVIIVTPSVYGTDNSATLYGLKARGVTARGIAVIDRNTSERDLATMASSGICGIRINAQTAGTTDPLVIGARFQEASERVAKYKWHVQMYTNLAVISGIKKSIERSPVPVVFDHFAGAKAVLGTEQPGFSDLLALLRSGKAYVKISGAYLASLQGPDYPDVAPLARALIAANPDHILWGTDWPHPNSTAARPISEVTHFRPIDDGHLLNQLAIWEPDGRIRKKILADNPALLYGF